MSEGVGLPRFTGEIYKAGVIKCRFHACPQRCGTNDNDVDFETNAMGVVLEGEDEVKLRYLTYTIEASRTFGKLAYTTWLRIFL